MKWLVHRKQPASKTDQELVVAYKKRGDRDAVGVLFERYAHLVFGVCMKYLRDEDDSKDATLQIFEKLMTDLKKFEVQKFNAWIHTIARNHCLMQLRGRKVVVRMDEEEERGWDQLPQTNQTDSRDERMQRESELNRLEEAIRKLNEPQRICVEMFYLEKYCYQDISEIAGYTLNEVKSHIQNGKRNLKIFLTKQNHETSGY